MTRSLPYVPLAKVYFPLRSRLRDGLFIVTGSLFIALLAQIAIPLPFTPVPITLQTLGVLLVGAALGSRLGFWSVAAYLVEGALGLPFFAGGSGGLAVFVGPDAGYLLAFPLAAGLLGLLVEHFGADRRRLAMFLGMSLASLLIYALGLLGLAIWSRAAGHPLSLGGLIALGMLPFLLGDILKALTAALLLPQVWRQVGRSTR
jgi:biotin transport system substrate-specific component